MALVGRRSLNIAIVTAVVAMSVQCGKENATEGVRLSERARLPATSQMTPIRVNVIPDGFTSSTADERLIADFRRDVLEAVMNDDPFDRLPLTAIEFSVSTHRVPTPLRSGLGITPKPDGCYFDLDADFRTNLADLNLHSAALNIIVMHIDGVAEPDLANVGACAKEKDLIITSNIINRHAIAHEIGHAIAGLKDETDDTGGSFAAITGVKYQQPNCSDDRMHPEWCFGDCTANVSSFEGCDRLKRGLFRPTDDCRMRFPASQFCCVCTEYMRRKLVDMLHFPIPADTTICTVRTKTTVPQKPQPAFGALITADFYSMTDARMVGAPETGAGDARAELITGELYASLVSDGNVVASVPLIDDPAFARAYPARLEKDKAVHERVKAPFPTRITFFIPLSVHSAPPFKPVLISLPGNSGVELLKSDVLRSLTNKLLRPGSPP